MENKTYTSKDMDEFKIMQTDLDKAFNDFMKDKKSLVRNPIGYNK